MKEILVVFTTAPGAEAGAEIARRLVEEEYAACVNLIDGVRSFYRWEGKLQDDAEVLLVAKIRADRFDDYEARMKELHPYDVPEILALAPEKVHEPYLNWCLSHSSGVE